MTKHPSRVVFVLALVLVFLFAFAGAALAQDEGAVVGEGFNGPMGVLVDPEGNIWVIDSGLGGEETTQAFNPEAGGLITVTVGNSSRIARINVADGSIDEIAQVASLGVPEAGFSGGSRLALLDGDLFATAGDWDNVPTSTAPSGIAVIDKIGADGTVEQVFDGWAYEVENNPYGVVYHAHPYGLLGGEDGKLWVADAGANTIYSVDPATGDVGDLVVLEPLPGAFPRPDYDNQLLTDPVPTGIAIKDGVRYVSLLSGVPFVPGSAKVLAIGEDGALSDYATGLTMLMDLRSGPDGELYAVSFGTFGPEGPVPNSGALLRIKEGDASEVIVGSLSFPSSVDFDADGNAYVTVNAVGAPGSGQVLRFDGVTEVEGTPYAAILAEMMAAMAPPADASAAVTETATLTDTEALTEAEPMAETEAMTETLEPANTMVNVADALREAGMFVTLQSAIDAADLTDALNGEGPFTLFAPTDPAFAALSLKDRIGLYKKADALGNTLLNHVVEGMIESADITDGMTAESMAGETLTFAVDGDKITVNGVPISRADIAASNGVVHAIEGVLLLGAGAEAAAVTEEAAAEETTGAEAATEAAPSEAVTTTVEAAPSEAVTGTVEAAPAEAAPSEAVTGTVEAAPAEAAPSEAVTGTVEAAPAEAAPAEAAPSEAAAEEAPAPETLPTTGGSELPSFGILVGALAVVAIAGVAWVTRRRTA